MFYEVIYPWNVMDELKKGSDVFVTDRTKQEVLEVSCMEVCEFIEVLNQVEKEKTRFEFWIRVKECKAA